MRETPMSKDDWPEWMTRRELAEYLKEAHGIRRSISTLASMAIKGTGPRFARDGRFTAYFRPEVDAWARQWRSPLVRSTRELRRIRAEAADLEAA